MTFDPPLDEEPFFDHSICVEIESLLASTNNPETLRICDTVETIKKLRQATTYLLYILKKEHEEKS